MDQKIILQEIAQTWPEMYYESLVVYEYSDAGRVRLLTPARLKYRRLVDDHAPRSFEEETRS